MKIRLVGSVFFHENGRSDMTKPVAFSSIANVPKKCKHSKCTKN